MTTMHPMLLKVEEAAQVLRMSRSRIYDLIRLGELNSVKVFGSRRIPVQAVHDYVKSLIEEND